MASLIIPNEVTFNDGASVGDNATSFQGCILGYDTADATLDGETVTRGEYLKKYLFSGKYDDIITFEKYSMPSYPNNKLCGMHIDAANIGNFMSMFVSNRYSIDTIAMDLFRDITQESTFLTDPYYLFSDQWTNVRNGVRGYKFLNAYSAVPTGLIGVRAFDSFMLITFYRGVMLSWTTSTSSIMYLLYDVANHELFYFNSTLLISLLVTPDSSGYSPVMTLDGAAGDIITPSFRISSVEEVTHTKIRRLDGIESTRLYFLTQFPEQSAWNTIHVGDKYFLILPYDTSTSSSIGGSSGHEMHCAVAIDVTEDLENQ